MKISMFKPVFILMLCFAATTAFCQSATATITDGGGIVLDTKAATSDIFTVDLSAYSNYLGNDAGAQKLAGLFDREHISVEVDRSKKQMTIRLQHEKAATKTWGVAEWNTYLQSSQK